MDEKLMMREQERLAQEKKRKKNRRKIRIAGVVVLVAAIGGIWYLGWGRHLGEAEDTTVRIETGVGQRIVYADLNSVKGNEITYQVAQEMEQGEEMEAQEQRGGMPDRGQMPEGMEMPEMGGVRGGMRGGMSGEMSQRGTAGTEKETFTYDGVTYEVTDETVTTLIPVGTDVTTKLGTVTTFSRLTAGDKIALVVEEDANQVITAVYIIE